MSDETKNIMEQGVGGINMNSNIVKGVGLLAKSVWEFTEGQTQQAITDFFAGLGLFNLHNAIIGSMEAKGMQPLKPGDDPAAPVKATEEK